jgi:acyl-CoA synthetase (NDP forming)/GNAT superfamily N-acetyltransferase
MPATAPEPGHDAHGHDALAADGAIVRIREARRGDRAALVELYQQTSDENLYRRFMGTGRGGIQAEADRLTRPAGEDHAAVLATERDRATGRDRVLGVASYERLPTPEAAEFAVLVHDAAHGRGIATLLLEQLAATARRHGIHELVGDVLAGNHPMLQVAHDLGPPLDIRPESGVLEVRVRTDQADNPALEARNRVAERHSLTPLLAPRAVAVIGAGRNPAGIGHAVLRSLLEGGFTGPVYPVNPHADQIAGHRAYPSAGAIGAPVDLAVLAVPAAAVPGAVEDCAAAGIRAVVVLSSGFGEDSQAGKTAQAELVRTARRYGMRLVGPNCLGVLNTDPAVRMRATFAATTPPPGGLAVASQSGAVAITILDHAARTGVGLSTFVSLGNKADVSGNDLLSYWYDDPNTHAVALYLESVGNPRRFARIARAIARRKPVLAVKGGRTATGARVGASHTAAAAAPDATVDALFAQAGVIRCTGLGELLDTARLLVDQPLPGGTRLAIIGNAGGVNVLAADAADAAGLTVPVLSAPVRATIAEAAPTASTAANPVDLGAAATPTAVTTAIQSIVDSGEADAVLVVFAATFANDVPAILDAIGKAADRAPIPVAVVLLGVPEPPASLAGAPVYPLPEQAVTAIGHAARYAAWRAQPLGSIPALADVDESRARMLVQRAVPGWQPPDVAAEVLDCFGIPVLRGMVVHDADTAVAAAAALGYPAVLKAADPGLVHKSDVGAVHVGLTDTAAVTAAYHAVTAATGSPDVLVQHQVHGTVELVAGVVHDPLFGSLTLLGHGGVHTDLFADRVLRLLPVTDLDAAAMWRSLRIAPLLTGYRGNPAVDTAAVEDLVLRLGRLAEELPEVAELDLNPVLAGPDGVITVDVKLRLATTADEPDPAVRELHEPTG